ncbi:toxin YoeB [Pseudorhizobium tarimense]|uniref:Putative mRNA interferase YoeB n=1 Tax=Pseudorhizobium tarimense TaxID=1079109 RepID=A0ABV2H5U2_9HYPH|nr:Txe/YoeB family addiction module toxin [Pseudorhizobium tarimense]MCJ8519251.1 Txe/YoeB family addiction module toxin [Pseudorhizobium tarimense]
MKLVWTNHAWDDYLFWQRTDIRMVERVNELIRDAKRSPFSGLGKPEPLKGDLAGFWSRRISGAHRFVYKIAGPGLDQRLEIVQCRFHYRK